MTKSRVRFFALTIAFLISVACSKEKYDFTSTLKNVIRDYYDTYNEKEKFTAIQATVLIPQNQINGKEDIKTAVIGTYGQAPFTQEITATSLFDIGSITKSFTALILLQLQTEGKLSLDDQLGKWLPQYPHWKEVTLRQLLNMTSGIPNYSGDNEFLKKLEANLSRVWTDEELLTYAHPERPLPKARANLFEYSNSNYILAAMVIERIMKDTFANQLKLRIVNAQNGLNNTFYPAGLNETVVQKAIAPRRVHGYFYNEDTQKLYDTIDNSLSWAGPAGAIVANTEDVAQWVQLLYHGSLINPQYREHILAELQTVVSMKTGKPISTVSEDEPAGFGLGVGLYYDKALREKFWIYKGSTLGFRVMYFWQPCNNVTTVVALNSKAGEGNPDSQLGDEILKANLNLYQAVIEHYPELKCVS